MVAAANSKRGIEEKMENRYIAAFCNIHEYVSDVVAKITLVKIS